MAMPAQWKRGAHEIAVPTPSSGKRILAGGGTTSPLARDRSIDACGRDGLIVVLPLATEDPKRNRTAEHLRDRGAQNVITFDVADPTPWIALAWRFPKTTEASRARTSAAPHRRARPCLNASRRNELRLGGSLASDDHRTGLTTRYRSQGTWNWARLLARGHSLR